MVFSPARAFRAVRLRLHSRWQSLLDGALCAVTALLFALSGTAVSVPLAVAQLAPLIWRRRFPAAVLIVVGGATAAHTALGMARSIGFLPAMISLYTAAAHRSPMIRWVLCPAIGLVVAAASAVRGGLVEGLLTAGVTATVAWLAGVERGEHLRQRAEAERQGAELRVAEQKAAAAEDRERLARRVHDTLAHTVTVMLLQTEALRATTTLDPAGERRLDAVLGAGRKALGEVRAALADGEEQDSAALLAARLETLRTAGLRLAADLPDLRDVLSAPVRAIADRLIGEAATNALRHDGPGTVLTIAAVPGAGSVLLRITSEPSGSGNGPAPGVAAGFGLRSLRRDINGYGGELTYGPSDPSGWRIEAELPRYG